MENFHHFIYGTHFILEMDQKLLEVILSKYLNHATPWLQRILIWTFLYHFTVCHIPGPTNQLADCLSRIGNQKDNIKLPKLYMYQITLNSTYNEVAFNKKSSIMKENLCTKYTPFTYKYIALNEKLPIMKQNLCIFFFVIGRVECTSQLRARSDTLNQLCTATQEDDELILLKHTITNGWPNSIKGVPPEIQAYWMFQKN